MTNEPGEPLAAYQASPNPQTLSVLVARGAKALRRDLCAAFRNASHWRIAQHLAMAWSNKIGPAELPPDLTRAAYFAHVSCQLSNEHPWARFARASIYWERRLTYLVLDDAQKVHETIHRLDEESQRAFLLAQFESLRVCAMAYEGRVAEAISLAEQLRAGPYWPTDEAVLQCFISTRPTEGELHHRAAMLSASQSRIFAKRPREALERAIRRSLLVLLNNRATHV